MDFIRSFLRRRSRSKPLPTSPSEPSSPSLKVSLATPAEVLERVFNKFDTNGDGKISSSELAAIFESLGQPLNAEEIEKMMSEADSDGDGYISLEEFVDINTATSDPASAIEDLRQAFSVYDLDRNGSISAEELAQVLRRLGEPVTLAQCKRMIKGVDLNGDGMISFEEFKIMMTGSSALAVNKS